MEETHRKRVSSSSIPDELIFYHVLIELPVKSLLRFRCVSKLWRSTIDDPFFVDSHHARSQSRPGGTHIVVAAHTLHGEYRFYSVKAQGGGQPVQLGLTPQHPYLLDYDFQSVNGLVCFGNQIWNPSTRESITFPLTFSFSFGFGFGFDVRVSVSCYLLGFDPLTNKHKILNLYALTNDMRRSFWMPTDIWRRKHEERYTRYGEGKILTLGTNTWRDLVDFPHSKVEGSAIRSVVYINGVIYILFRRWSENRAADDQGEPGVLLAFDVGPEMFRAIPLPQGTSARWSSMSMINLRERLAFVDFGLTMVCVLEEDYPPRWRRESLIFPHCWPQKQHFKPIGSLRRNEILMRLDEQSPKLFCYDLESQTLRTIHVETIHGEKPPFDIFYVKHVESLVRLKI